MNPDTPTPETLEKQLLGIIEDLTAVITTQSELITLLQEKS